MYYQPYVKDDIAIIFNGEIYNYKSLNSSAKNEAEMLYSLYLEKGDKFVDYLDGEYVIVILDKKNDKILI
mgnify:CR=1 FL=1